MTTFYQRMRLKHGLHWQSKYPPLPWRSILIIIFLVLVYGLADYVTTLGDYAAEMEKIAESNKALAQITLDCMNGAVGFGWRDAGLIYECGKKL